MGRKKTPEWVIHKEKAPKDNIIQSDNSVLIVGSGPSTDRYLSKISKFPGKIMVVDDSFGMCIEAGINIDYAITRESVKHRFLVGMFQPYWLEKFHGMAIGSSVTPEPIIQYFKDNKIPFDVARGVDESMTTNVGLFGVVYAHDYLKCDKIFIIGFEHEGDKYPDLTYRTWRNHFWWYVKKWPAQTVVNLCDGGTLYYKYYVVDTTLDRLKIVRTRNHNTG